MKKMNVDFENKIVKLLSNFKYSQTKSLISLLSINLLNR